MITRFIAKLGLKITLPSEADCNTDGCDWLQHESRYARSAAKEHVRMFGHQVTIETKRLEQWGPR